MNTLMIRIDHIYLYFFLLVGRSTRFKHLKRYLEYTNACFLSKIKNHKKISSLRPMQIAFSNTAPFREKKLKGDVSINAFPHDVVEFLLKVQISRA